MKNRVIGALPVAALLAASLAAPAMAAVINGTGDPDVLIGTARADTIRGYAGSDVLRGRDGADRIFGGKGADRLYGGKDLKPDLLYGSSGNDDFYVRGRDKVHAGAGNDVVHGLPYQVMLVVEVHCGPGYDRVVGLNPWLVGLGGPDTDCEVYPGG